MSQCVKKHLPLLKWLSTAKPKVQKSVIRTLDNDALQAIHECCVNVLKGNVPLTHAQKQRLSRYKKVIRKLGAKGGKAASKRRLVQTGGFLGALIPPILGVLGSLLFK